MMKLGGRHIAWMALLVMLVACDDGTTPDPMAGDDAMVDPEPEPDSGMQQIPDPPFNYIPLNDEACDLSTKAPGVQLVVQEEITALLQSGQTYADDGFEMCTEAPLNNCPGCTEIDNKFLELLRDIDEMGFTAQILGEELGQMAEEGLPEAGLVGYVQRALNYPYRHLTATVSRCEDLPRGECPELCWNGLDEDRDGAVDCDDDDCADSTYCTVGEQCGDDMDNDGDGAIDCADLECWDDVGCVPENCTNGVDDDGNGFADCQDWQCEGDFACGAVTARVTLTQGARQPCADGDLQCGHFSVEPESFDLSCTQFSLRFYGRVGPVVDIETGAAVPGSERFRGKLFRDAVEDVTFGFVVPLVRSAELPPLDPPLTDAELESWLELLEGNDKRLDAKMRDPEVDLRLDTTNGTGCGRMSGLIEPSFIDQFLEGENPELVRIIKDVLLPRYEDADFPGAIPTILSFDMQPGTFTAGAMCQPNPCAESEGACEGDVLQSTLRDNICRLPRPDGFTTGDEIDPICEDGPVYNASIDCAALGGTCDAAAVNCDPAFRTPVAGDLVFTEVFIDSAGFNFGTEWVEMQNIADVPLQLNDCRFQGRDTIYGERESITGFDPVLLAPGEIVVVARLAGPDETATFDGVETDIVLSAADSVALEDGDSGDVYRVLCPGDDGNLVVVDRVEWQGLTRRVAWQLDPGAIDPDANDDPANWCDATEVFAERDTPLLGTPGVANPPCP